MKREWINITGLFLLMGAQLVFGQSGGDERGLPFPSEHYAPQEYQQDRQNWAVAQDERGVIYVANNNGVLEYDGERWRLIPTSTGSFVRSLAVDSLVFVGAKGDFGYLRPDSLGVLRYKSLYNQIPPDERDFEDVWGTHVLDDGVYYQANKRLFRWDGADLKSWASEEGFHTSFTVDGTLYLRDYGRGLLRMKSDSLKVVPGGEEFRDTPIYMMASHPSGDLLVGTQNKGLLLYDGNNFRSLAPQLTSYLQENDLYHGCRLPGNRYALATLGGGVVIVNVQGRVVRVLDGSSGLPDEIVNYVYTDREGQLWMALNSGGVYRADVNAPLSLHDQRTGLEGAVQGIYEHNDSMYVATGSGLYVLKERENQVLEEQSAYFEKWEQHDPDKGWALPLVMDMLSFEEDLLVATQEQGVSRIEGRSKKQIGDWIFTYDLLSTERSRNVFAGTRTGLKALVRNQGEWTYFSVKGVQGEMRSLAAEASGTLWASRLRGDVIRIVLSDGSRRVKTTTKYGTEAGLPTGYKRVKTIDGQVTVVAKKGVFQIANPDEPPESWNFASEPSLLPEVDEADTLTVRAFVEGRGGELWVALGDRVFVGKKTKNGSYDWEAIEPLHFEKSDEVRMSVGQDGTLWLGDGQKLYRYAPGQRREVERPPVEFHTLVRQVTTLRRGKVVYGGEGETSAQSTLTLPFGKDLRIDVAAPLYSTVNPHQYQYKLAGRTDQWSDWTTKASQRYRNLWEGTYQFQVRARNDRGTVGNTASLTLHVQPPWYRSAWAYLLYGVAFVVVAYGYRRYYQIKEENRRARERVRKLERERVVAERLKRANERLREANRLKEDFLATTSHELRTPLTNILGSLQVLRDTATEEQKSFLDIIEENGKRLKRTLNALLDLSMLRSGNEDLDQTPIPVDECVRQVASDLKGDAEEKGLSFQVDTPEVPVRAGVDEQYLEQILRNLVENAIKFTDEGHVRMAVGGSDGRAYVQVEDTGIGIDEEFLPDLFDEFKQESRGRARTYEGNGLGLAISKRLAEQMDGTIHVETEKGGGSTFTVEFPRTPTDPSTDSNRKEA